MDTRITATDAARRLSDLLNRVRYRGESFLIVRNGEEVAQLRSTSHAGGGATFGELVRIAVANRTGDSAFADDLQSIHDSQPVMDKDPWAS